MLIENDDIDDYYQEYYINPKDSRCLRGMKMEDQDIFKKDNEEEKSKKNIFEIMKKNTSLIKCYICSDEKGSKSDLNSCEICPRKICGNCLKICSKCELEICSACCSRRKYKKGSFLTCNSCIMIN